MPPQLGGRCGRTPRWSDRPGPRAKRVDDVITRRRIVNVIRPAAAVHHRDSSVASAVPSVSSQWCRSRGRPTNADTSLALPITQRCSLPQIGAPRFNWGRIPTAQADPIRPVSRPQGTQAGYAGHAGNDRQYVPLLLAGHHTYAPRCHRDRSPSRSHARPAARKTSTCLTRIFRGEPGFAHIRRPFSRQYERRD